MKIVNFGSTYKIYGDDLKTYDKLPAATYKVTFHPMSGFALEQVDNFETTEEKIYGSHAEKIKKVLKSYDKFNRSMGLILSGKKGMGKSMFVQLIGEEVIKRDIPVILVTKAFIGIADFIEEIDQEALIIFDEFEKMFYSNRNGGYGQQQQKAPDIETQDNLLGLFDGTSQKKRLYAITVNDLTRVNEFMLSRPGRFHYHIRFDFPSSAEIEEYLGDKVEKQYHGEIKNVVSFSSKVKLNYDSLRAIAFELNEGYTFASAISDLNILTTEQNRYDVKVVFSDGKSHDLKSQNLNLFAEEVRLDGYASDNRYFSLTFNPANIVEETLQMYVPADAIEVHLTDGEGDPVDSVEVRTIIIKQHHETGVNYKLAY
jgi:SpoVK/Ycf46/Vps4 family AAA+-type ATPase